MATFWIDYEERFEQFGKQVLHCIICGSISNDPVMCHNEHLFCRACITIHLKYFSQCPTCMEPLTVETLRQAFRFIVTFLSEIVYEDERFKLIVSETLHCVICFNVMRDPVMCQRNEHLFCRACITRHLTYFARCPSCYEPLTVETLSPPPRSIKKFLFDLDKEISLVEQTTRERERETSLKSAAHEEQKREISDVDEMDREPKVVIAGGVSDEDRILSSVKMFNPLHGIWAPLHPMNECRCDSSSIAYQNHFIVMGGITINGATASAEKLSLDAVESDQSITWENVDSELPGKLVGHCSVICHGRLIVVGGFDGEQRAYSDSITEITLVPPYTSELLATMPQKRSYHGVAIFDDKILIVGGRAGIRSNSILRSVVMYDITKNEFQELSPLPYPVCEMATVKWGNENVMIMGGVDRNTTPLNKVLMYNITTQESHELPNMKYKRKGCVAAVVRGTVIVMGGHDGRGSYLKSVEKFIFRTNSWEELPEMPEKRNFATAVVY